MPTMNLRFLLASLLVAVLASLVFTPGLPGEFMFDDIPNIINNPVVHLTQLNADAVARLLATQQVSGATRSLPTLSFAVDYWRADGLDPMVFKTTNIIMHALTACALTWLFRSLLLLSGVSAERARWAAPVLALAWAAHPLQVSAVLYAVQRLQIMGTLFLVLALRTYLGARQAQLEGRSGRTGLLATVLLWAAAMGCKEDSALLPAYTLALELTVLRFGAADPGLGRKLRRGYLAMVLAGTAAYFLLFLPHFWSWEAYHHRDFSSIERLLTQGRVLCRYLWQILVPLPGNMPFFYDWIQPSRGLLQPWTTLPAFAVVLALLGSAWRLRGRWPLFALGVFLFFASHFIASNALDLELAFEHRNHFALIGAVLASGSALAYAGRRLHVRSAMGATACAVVLVALASATLLRAHSWRTTASIASVATVGTPGSGRAWVDLCASHFRAGGGAVVGNPRLDAAIETCSKGAAAAPQSLNSLTLLMVLKTLRGDATREDWDRLQQRMHTVPMTRDNARVFTILISHKRLGVDLDKGELLETLAIVLRRANLGPRNLANVGYFVMNDLAEPALAAPYLVQSVEAAPSHDPLPRQLVDDLKAKGMPDLAETIESAAAKRQQTIQR